MQLSHKLIFLCNAFSIGITAPVLSLLFLSHGASLSTLSLFFGLFAITVIILEVPSGMIADRIGRKKVFLLAHIFLFCYFFLLLHSDTPSMLTVCCILLGCGRAFSSGSIEALEVEQCMERHGSDYVPKINSTLAVIDSLGLALGSLFGGFLGYINSQYDFLLITLLMLEVITLFSSACFIHESIEKSVSPNCTDSIFREFHRLSATLKSSKTIITILIMSTILGILLATIETYWQPTLMNYLPPNYSWTLGIVSCLGYLGVSIGNKLGEWLLTTTGNPMLTISSGLYWILKLLLPFTLIPLGFCKNWYLFILLFMIIYIVLGAGNLFENTIFHLTVDNDHRASMLSMLSLFLRGGGIPASILGSLILANIGLNAVWILLPFAAIFATILVMLRFIPSS